jgi:hypothetical protein
MVLNAHELESDPTISYDQWVSNAGMLLWLYSAVNVIHRGSTKVWLALSIEHGPQVVDLVRVGFAEILEPISFLHDMQVYSHGLDIITGKWHIVGIIATCRYVLMYAA